MNGKTIIELKDEKTGLIETYEDKNMTTNALRDIFSINFDGVLLKNNLIIKNLLPLVKKAIGGVLLFTDPLEENPDNYYAPSSNPCVGYASNDVNTTANVLRGSFNEAESKKIDGGYKYVWDFGTSQGNGTISSVALTSAMGGRSFMGDEYSNLWHMTLSSDKYHNDTNHSELDKFSNAIDVDVNAGITTLIKYNESLKITKIKKPLVHIDLFYDYGSKNYEVIDEFEIKPSGFKPKRSGREYEIGFVSYGDYYYGFYRNYLNSIKWIKISKKDYSYTEGEWTFKDIKFNIMGSHDYYLDSEADNTCTICNNYLYTFSEDKKSVYKINLDKIADVKKIDLGVNEVGRELFTFRDYVINSNFYITSDDRVIKKTNNKLVDRYDGSPLFHESFMLRQYTNQYDGKYREVDLVTPYLATINNLSSPIIKTADKTMKIIYTITEGE